MTHPAPTSETPVRIGFVPLNDCAILVAAREGGFAARHGLRLDLQREASWAAIRDKVSFGALDAAHMLAGLPLAARLALGGTGGRIIAPMALGLGGNAITVSRDLHERMAAADAEAMTGPVPKPGRALKAVIAAARAAGRPPLAFASVSPFSSHNFELRYWLAGAGIDPDRDVNLGIVAPPRMAESLRAGWIDGYCVGEPWNLRAEAQGIGRILLTKQDIWPNGPEKVLGVNQAWAERHPGVLARLIRALAEAAQWADQPENRPVLAELLARPDYVGAPLPVLRAALCGLPDAVTDSRHTFFRHAATYPWPSHGVWLLSQMVRWGQVPPDVDFGAVAGTVYRPDLYRRALAGWGIPLPAEDGQALSPFMPSSV